jgi:hypothetical protein
VTDALALALLAQTPEPFAAHGRLLEGDKLGLRERLGHFKPYAYRA